MKHWFPRVTLFVGIFLVPATVAAQEKKDAPKTEFGVDLGFFYNHEGSGCTTDCGRFWLSTPVDLRVGFPTSQSMSLEPRATVSYVSQAGTHLLSFVSDINLLFGLEGSNRKGPYVTGGVGIAYFNATGSSGTNSSATQLSINGGVGTRIPFESAGWRLEGFFRYRFENSDFHGSYDIGARVGISFFK